MKGYHSKSNLLVSVCMITYNHAKYIRTAIDSILLQESDFKIELVIGEDYSKDNTRAICREYTDKYPDVIRLLSSERNIGMIANFSRTLRECRGKYIAVCEGDDYWTDRNKLKKQVGFLEANPDYGLCYGDITVIDENNDLLSYDPSWKKLYKSGYIFCNLFIQNFVPTLTTVFRKNLMDSALQNLDTSQGLKVFDYWFWLHISMFSKFKFINEKLAAYRDHIHGITESSEFKTGTFLQMVSQIRVNIIEYYCNTSKSNRINPGIKSRIILLKSTFQLFYQTPGISLSQTGKLKYLFKIAFK